MTSTSLLAERNGHMHHRAGDVRRRAERRIPDDVEVGEARQTERVAEAPTTGALDVEEQFRVARQLDAGVDRPQPRQRLLRVWSQAVVPLVRRRESSVRLRDEIHLAGQPPAAVIRTRQCRCICRGRVRSSLCTNLSRTDNDEEHRERAGRKRIPDTHDVHLSPPPGAKIPNVSGLYAA